MVSCEIEGSAEQEAPRPLDKTASARSSIARGTRRFLAWVDTHHAIFTVLVVAIVAVLVQWDLLFKMNGCVTWGNYNLPCTNSQYAAYVVPGAFWNSYAYMGSPITFPNTDLLSRIFVFGPIYILAQAFGPATAAKLFAVLSTIFLGITFYLLAKTLVRDYWGRLVGSIFIVAGPFQLQLFANGDYEAMVAQGFVFLSIYLLWYGLIKDPGRRWIFYPSSFAALLFSLMSIAIFALGLATYVVLAAAFIFLYQPGSFKSHISSFLKFAVRFLALPLILVPLILPAILAPPFDLGPSSSYATPLNQFTYWSAPAYKLFLGLGYNWVGGASMTNNMGYQMISAASSPTLAAVWLILTIMMVVIVWIVILLLRDPRGYLLLGLAILGSLFGSGTYAPLGGLNTYLYTHLTGYQILNISYVWDWVVVVPAFALSIGILIERVRAVRTATPPPTDSVDSTRQSTIHRLNRMLRFGATPRSRSVLTIIGALACCLILILTVIPYSVNAQYGPIDDEQFGIQTIPYPSDYAQIPDLLSKLVGSTYAGVAVFNPSLVWFLPNSSVATENYFYYFPSVRTPGIPGYAIPPYPSSFYSYWVYDEFYSNSTRYVGELLAVAGIEYLLVFTGTEAASYLPYSDGANVIQLLKYQSGIVPVVSSRDFSIYRNLYFSNVAASVSGISAVTGGYSELNAMAYGGLNLTNQDIVFPEDIPTGECDQYLNDVSRIYTGSVNELYELALTCASSYSSNPLSRLTPGLLATNGWVSSYSALSGSEGLQVADSWPAPIAVADGGPFSISIPVNTGSCQTSCTIWLPVRFGGDAESMLDFKWGNMDWEVDTSRGFYGSNNSMVWVQLPFGPIDGSGTLQITSYSGWNAIGTVYVASSASLQSWLLNIEQTKTILFMTPGDSIQPPTANTAVGQISDYCGAPSAYLIEGTALCLTALGTQEAGYVPLTLNLTVVPGSSGWLSLLVRSLTLSKIEIGENQSQLFGFDTGDQNWSSPVSTGWIRIPVNSSELGPNGELQLQIMFGAIILSEVSFVPFATYGFPTPSVTDLGISFNSEDMTSSVSQFNISSQSVTQSESVLSGDIQFQGSMVGEPLGNVTFHQSTYGGNDLAVEYSISPGLEVTINGMQLGGSATSQFSQLSSELYYGPGQTQPGILTLTFSSLESSSAARTNASFSIWFEYIRLALDSNDTDVEPGSNWNVTTSAQGYQLEGGPSALVLVRVPYYSSLAISPANSVLDPALGSVDTLVWNPGASSSLQVYSKASVILEESYILCISGLIVWLVLEYRWRIGRTKAKPRTTIRGIFKSTPRGSTKVTDAGSSEGDPKDDPPKPEG
jgi:hypothetical protein